MITATARPLHVGSTTIVMETEVRRADGELVAKTTQTQTVLRHARGRRLSPRRRPCGRERPERESYGTGERLRLGSPSGPPSGGFILKLGSWRRISRRAMVILCTSSGPSAMRSVRMLGVHLGQRGVLA